MRLRIASAAIMAPVALAAVYAGGWFTVALVALAGVLAVNEWDRLCGGRGLHGTVGILHALILVVAALLAGLDLYLGAVIAMVGGMAAVAAFASVRGRGPIWPATGVLYLALPTLAFIWMRGAETGLEMLIWLLAVVWASDIGAIFAGKTLGGPRLWPRVSPGKTWAGLVGGLVAAGLVGAVTAVLREQATVSVMVALSVGLAAVSQGGDLAESAVKRYYGVKDTSTLIPGHGGILDRVDGLLFALPVAAMIAILNGGSALVWP